nr:MAG TPA: hypothetical protein [Bacteriophage sp.]
MTHPPRVILPSGRGLSPPHRADISPGNRKRLNAENG